jgi:hypothetical protein
LHLIDECPAQKEPETKSDQHSSENLIPFHPKSSTSPDGGKHRGQLIYAIGERNSLFYLPFLVR